jgi:hypothetical protein
MRAGSPSDPALDPPFRKPRTRPALKDGTAPASPDNSFANRARRAPSVRSFP